MEEGSLVELLVVAPAGAVMMAGLMADGMRIECLDDLVLRPATNSDLAQAVTGVQQASFAEFAEVAVHAQWFAGPYSETAPSHVARALLEAPACRSLAEAIVT